jgi:hypothetical protein
MAVLAAAPLYSTFNLSVAPVFSIFPTPLA